MLKEVVYIYSYHFYLKVEMLTLLKFRNINRPSYKSEINLKINISLKLYLKENFAMLCAVA
jgi:hypothetical protein